MLFAYKYVKHDMDKMQKFINFVFYQVWCVAPKRGDFHLDLFDANLKLKEVMTSFYYGHTKGGDFFYGHVEGIYGLFAQLTRSQIAQFKRWYQANNDIRRVCSNDTALRVGRYTDIAPVHKDLSEQLAAFFKGLYSKELLDLAALRNKIGDIDDHYQHFMQENQVGKCPFCGLADMQGVYHSKREAYDHYLPKALYPFNSINFHNLVPACHQCNSSYKTSQDPAYFPKDPVKAATRRKFFYPYDNQGSGIEIKIKINKSDVQHITPEHIDLIFGPATLHEEIETWKDVYGIDERFKAKCCSGDAKDWLEQVRILKHVHGLDAEAFLGTLSEQTTNDPFANSNFIKKAFLDAFNDKGLFENI
jgi:hypothetical protein